MKTIYTNLCMTGPADYEGRFGASVIGETYMPWESFDEYFEAGVAVVKFLGWRGRKEVF